MRPGAGASGVEPERKGVGHAAACRSRAPSVVEVTGGTRTRAAVLTTPNAARYTTVTVASAGIEPAWRRRMKPAEPQALPAVGTRYARLDSNQRPPPSQGGARPC